MKINAPFVEKILTKFIKEELSKFHFSRGILGLSGGLDSTVCAFLASKALDPDNVLCLDHPTDNKILIGNKMARERMSILYDHSARDSALILGTSNKTELLLGYGTIHGDMACAISPLGDLYKTQIRELAQYMGVPEKILKKAPTAGLWEGQTDEGELGLTYENVDRLLYQMVDKRRTADEVIAEGFKKEMVERVIALVKNSEFKRKLPPIVKISDRTVGHDFLFPYDREK
jgi:NAD+ synthase